MKKLSVITRRRISEAMKGKKHSEETKRKISEGAKKAGSGKWRKGKKMSAEVRRRMSLGQMGREFSEETRKKISNALKGKIVSAEHKRNISLAKRNSPRTRRGEESPLWRGGITTYERKLWLNGRRRALKKGALGIHSQGEWETLKAQYNWTCPACGKKEPGIKLTEDHIVPLDKGGSDNIENIQPLCRSCNSKKHCKVIKY